MYIKARVYPKSKKEEFKEVSENHFEIKIKEKAERNMANKKVIELVAKHFNVEEGKVRIVNGHQSPSKLLSINID
ncbi:hypothetical protein A3E89_00960 [Candidatus Campbellbacteria bacterium RIFCSPHIGHO2_12_FULL_35_10]|uniref:Uncharacterized protein n=1 Tax=Candidatus Campbellbacteria bacterium RIFCSPHIGHO2_12_FULL_35_10 TaxID=1797578 RepID=A0A1F5EP18_9BACT|nr:MAG: hypothetical protein A3E89_00960 [Candidatus Campbellbacteria bacterium RIFCSPHIGHO2_12_FULL_35_10]